jgi:hypothetical protein
LAALSIQFRYRAVKYPTILKHDDAVKAVVDIKRKVLHIYPQRWVEVIGWLPSRFDGIHSR